MSHRLASTKPVALGACVLLALIGALSPIEPVQADIHQRPSPGALSGKRIFLSAGHGWYAHSTLGWITQYSMPLLL